MLILIINHFGLFLRYFSWSFVAQNVKTSLLNMYIDHSPHLYATMDIFGFAEQPENTFSIPQHAFLFSNAWNGLVHILWSLV